MDTLIKWISALAPFLATCPSFVRVMFAAWVILGAALFVYLVLARPGITSQTPAAASQAAFEKQTGVQAIDERRGNLSKDIWMVIDGLEFFAQEGAQVRVVANVNGTEFLYPSRAGVEWLEVGPSMSSQVFRLPPAKERYIIRFKASVRVPPRDGESAAREMVSVTEDVVNVASDIPFTGRYVLHEFNSIHRSRSAIAQAELFYRLTYDPK